MTLPSVFKCGVNAICHVQVMSAPAFRSLALLDRVYGEGERLKPGRVVFNVHSSSFGRRCFEHVWHVRVSQAKELCILLTWGNKEKVRQGKNFSIAPGYCYQAAAKEFKI